MSERPLHGGLPLRAVGAERPPEAVLWDLMRGAMATRALAVVAELGVADALAEGSRPVEELAREVGADADTLHRLLRALASDGAFAEQERGVFRNTAASEFLRGTGWHDFAHLFGGVWYRTVGELDATGRPTFSRLFGTDFWSWLAAHPSERVAFDQAMGRKMDRVEVLAALTWRGDETVVDIGGGNGELLAGLLGHHAGLRGIVFDLPEASRDETRFGERLTFVAGSFFERVPSGDAYVLSSILHDWNDEHAAVILSTIRAAAPSGARVLIFDNVIPSGQRASRREVARRSDAHAARRPRARRGAMAGAPLTRRLRADVDRGRADPGAMPLTIGTAGHVDHGKTWLVRALTGRGPS